MARTTRLEVLTLSNVRAYKATDGRNVATDTPKPQEKENSYVNASSNVG